MLRFVEILTLRFGKAKVAKAGFCGVKRPIKIWNVDVNNIVISKLIETKNNSKYFKYNSIPKYNKHNISPAGNYMFKVNNRNSRTRCEICSKLTIKTPERR